MKECNLNIDKGYIVRLEYPNRAFHSFLCQAISSTKLYRTVFDKRLELVTEKQTLQIEILSDYVALQEFHLDRRSFFSYAIRDIIAKYRSFFINYISYLVLYKNILLIVYQF